MKDELPLNDATALLRELATPHGIRASRRNVANYAAIFARDAIMAGLAGLATGDDVVTAALCRTLEHLRLLQGPQGQIASNFSFGERGAPSVSFGTLAPRFDSATWYLVGVAAVCQHGVARFDDYRESVTRVIALLDGIEYNGRHLLYVPAGGNWADEYPFDGYILYDQVLRAWGLRLLAQLSGHAAWADKAQAIGDAITMRYWPDGDWRYGGPRRFPVAAISPVRTDEHIDLAACALLALSDVAPARTASVLDAIRDRYLAAGTLPPAFSPVIDEGDGDWEPLARYHLHGFRNRPHEYHNGGIWPVWLGWLALAFARHGRPADVVRLHDLTVAHLARCAHFDFEEYFHGRSGEALGTSGMAYTATGFVFLELARRAGTLELPWTR
jgi:hypothetical protein